MTTIAPPLRTQPTDRARTLNPPRARVARVTRTQAAARRGAVALAGAITLAIPAQLTLTGATTGSAVIAGATALGVVALLNLVVVGSIWILSRAYNPLAGGLAAGSLAVASVLQLYAALTLLMTGTSGVDQFMRTWATSLAVYGVHLLVLGAALLMRRSAGVVAVGVGFAGVVVAAAVMPPGWFPQTTDALLALTAGQALLLGWFATVGLRRVHGPARRP